ncbi:type VI secretion system Vgr family protein [Chondromyces crocatus]|uniref:Gp5/Type VI secretion system Vgr C-terminal trimerisation domain-containing protein n=1 Tax=Chondromyces crocatus TaxID=52 RepID=A0A0K1EC79_CHOCO|nr:type VI secretion system tip protein TssI/VgrG [Chondromyces crocatus]AKT38168.1 uncharacterized protein CMC5_023110 [Chondromyces crocatus]
MSEEQVGIELALDVDGRVRPVGCRVSEALSESTHAVVEIATDEDLPFDEVLGGEASLRISLGDGAERRWTLRVGAVEFSRFEEGTLRYEVHLYDHLWLLRHTRTTRKYRGLSAEQIVSEVLSRHQVAHVWQLSSPTRVREYCVQYEESDFDFVSRLLEFEGIYYAFDEEGVMVLADRSSAADKVAGRSSHFELLDAHGALSRGELGIFAFRRGARLAPGRVTVSDFDWKNPQRSLLTSDSAASHPSLEVYEYPAGFRAQAEGERLARLRLEAHQVRAHIVEGAGNVPTFTPGSRFAFGDAGGAAFEGEYFLVGVEHTARDGSFPRAQGDEEAQYGNTFRALPAATPFRPHPGTPRPTIEGCHTAVVRGPAGAEIHTDRFGRFRAQFHWDREASGTDQDSRWIRLLQESATSMVLARVGWEMRVAYIDGDPDRPVGIARAMNGVMPPAYAQPANKSTMTIKTPSSPATGGFSEIKLDDTAGAMLFSVRAERDYEAEIKHDKVETIGRDETREVGRHLTHTVGRDQSVVIGHDAKEAIGGDRRLEVKGDRTKQVEGSEKVDVGGSVTVSTAKDETEAVGSVRMTFSGGFQMPDLAARGKSVAKGLVPDPKAIGKKAVAAAKSGAQKGAKDGFEAAGGLPSVATAPGGVAGSVLGGAASGALGGVQESLTKSIQGMVPSASGIASKLTGGLSEGVTFGKLADQFLVGSISRTASEKMSRTVGGAFISAGVGNMTTTAGKAYVETVGGVKLTTSLSEGISESIEGQLVVTVGGAVVRSSVGDMTVSSRANRVMVGAALDLTSSKQVHVVSKEIEIVGDALLDVDVSGAGIQLTPAGIQMRGAVQIKSDESVTVTGKTHTLST